MKGSDYFNKLQQQLNDAELHKAILAAAFTVNADMSERIFVEGKASDGSDIGKYDTKTPLYVNPKNAPNKFPTEGKPYDNNVGRSTFKNGGSHKTGYFNSYSEYREKVGRKSEKVNLVLFGVLQSDFSKGPKPTASGASITLTGENELKREGQEERYKKDIFKHTPEELEKYYRLVKQQFHKV